LKVEKSVGLAGNGQSVDAKVSTQGAIVEPALSAFNKQETNEIFAQLLAARSPELVN
jgi:hypothetical protein